MSSHLPLYIIGAMLFVSSFSRTDMVPTKEVRLTDSLNGKVYAYRYRNLDFFYKYVNEAYRQVNFYKSGKAETSSNPGFCAFMVMDLGWAEVLHKEVYKLTKNELELSIVDIGLVEICQRTAMNKRFYDYRNSVFKRAKRIREESDLFADCHEALRLDYASTEFFIIFSIYYYYPQQRQEAITSLNRIPEDEALTDANRLLYYHYIKGSASLVGATKPEDRKMHELDQLYTTWRTVVQTNHPYFEGNGLQGLANPMVSPNNFELFRTRRGYALDQSGSPVDSLLLLRMVQRALEKLREYNDLYQVTGTYVFIGKYMNEHGRYMEALDTFAKALDCVNQHHTFYYHYAVDTLGKLHVSVEGDTTYIGVPWIIQEDARTISEWTSRIREQSSVSYAGLGMKYVSGYNRNIYLDILNYTRQDKELESRYLSLEADSRQTTFVLSLVIVGFVLVVIL